MVLKKWNEELHKHFPNLSESDVNLCSKKIILKLIHILFYFITEYSGFPASLHTDIWTQGRVFVSQYAVYFFSSLFGIGTKV